MDRIDKALRRLTPKEKGHVKELAKTLQLGRFSGLNIKKLKIGNDIFRVRKGRIRIIYQVRDNQIFILKITFRKEDTYRL